MAKQLTRYQSTETYDAPTISQGQAKVYESLSQRLQSFANRQSQQLDIQAQRDKTLEELRASYAEIMESLKLCQTQRVANIQAREAREQAIKAKENHTVHDSKLDKP